MKKIEEVVYDITLRGLHQPNNRKRALDEQEAQEDSAVKTKKTD